MGRIIGLDNILEHWRCPIQNLFMQVKSGSIQLNTSFSFTSKDVGLL